MQRKNYAATAYSELNQVNVANAKNLKVAWTFSTGALRGHEGAPLVVGTRMSAWVPISTPPTQNTDRPVRGPRLGRARGGSREAVAPGGGTPTIRSSTSYTIPPATPAPGTPRSAKGTINGR